jgi:hypothetical protein
VARNARRGAAKMKQSVATDQRGVTAAATGAVPSFFRFVRRQNSPLVGMIFRQRKETQSSNVSRLSPRATWMERRDAGGTAEAVVLTP